MAIDTTTPNRGYTLPATGNDVNTWGPLLNANFSAIDSNISTQFVVNTTGGTTTLTGPQAANLYFPITGALTSNAILVFPFVQSFFFCANNTTGAFTVNLAAIGNMAFVPIAQGTSGVFWSDGSNVFQIASSIVPVPPSVPSGSQVAFANQSVPVGWTLNASVNDQVIRLVNNPALADLAGGSWTVNGFSDTPVALTINQMPSHNHTITGNFSGNGTPAVGVLGGSSGTTTGNSTNFTGANFTHSHSPITNDGSWRPSNVTFILCQKN
jgi:hypothetical protein